VTWFVYILKCNNGSYYIGHTQNLDQRFFRHVHSTGARHTAVYKPTDLLYSESVATELAAIARELQLKKWSRAKKEALIAGNMLRLRELSRSKASSAIDPG
jgi:predicted GIY-YIG superfamily endonuclease